jgi:monovalent cation/hydrogen antiporter
MLTLRLGLPQRPLSVPAIPRFSNRAARYPPTVTDLHTALPLGLVVLSAMTALVILAGRLKTSYPILLVVGGGLLSLIPGLPILPNPGPDFTLLIVLPPLVYGAAWSISWRDIKANARAITLLAVGLVIATMLVVGAVAHAVFGMGWAAAFTLGAIVSPTDAIAATSMAGRLGAPRKLVTILEGESLMNDASGLVLYRVGLAAALTGQFSLADGVMDLVLVSAGGVAIGIAVAWISTRILMALEDSPVEITISVLTAYVAYLSADLAHASGVLACVAAGLYSGRRESAIFRPRTRLEAVAVWQTLIFLFNGVVFILVGLELSAMRQRLTGVALKPLALGVAAVCVAVVLTRLVWVFPGTYLPRLLSPSLRKRDPYPPWQAVVVLGWAGMRGAISLALALALPAVTWAGIAFPQRDLMILCTFAVILVTLVGQGLSLPWLMQTLKVTDDGSALREEVSARLEAASRAAERIADVAAKTGVTGEASDHLGTHYRRRIDKLAARLHALEKGERQLPEVESGSRRFRRELIHTERQELARLRDRGTISDDVLRRIERDLDLEEERL